MLQNCTSLFPPKDDEINHQSQMVEKLKEQMLNQEEVKDLSLQAFGLFNRSTGS